MSRILRERTVVAARTPFNGWCKSAPAKWVVQPETELGARIRDARERAGFSQGELAVAIRTSGARLSRWEIGRNAPRCDVLIRLCRVLEVSADWLLGLSQSGGPEQ